MTTNNNRYLKIILPTAFCALVVVIMLIVLSSCNSEKRTTRKAERKLDKSVRLDPMAAARYCATRYNPIDSINEKNETIQGKPIVTNNTVTPNYDSLWAEWAAQYEGVSLDTASFITYLKRTALKCPPCTSRVDTNRILKFERAANTAALDSTKGYYENKIRELEAKHEKKENAQAATIKEQDKKIARQSTTIKYQWWLIIALAIPWLWKLVRMIFKF